MEIHLTLECPVHDGFRVRQVAGLFDLPPAEKLREQWEVELPDDAEPWQIGAIVGPSGSGKSSIARHAYRESLYTGAAWPADRAVIDCFDEAASIQEITAMFSAVGFSSPPAWCKPYAVLSNGERFRCDLVRALLSDTPLVAYDEFTSVVDRTVAQIGSAAVAKSIRKGRIARRFVAVTCHYDVLDWLEPDWVLDMASRRLARRSLQPDWYRRPSIELQVAPVHRSAWPLFARHHYLSGRLSSAAACFVAYWGDRPVAFSAWTHRMVRGVGQGDMREHRTVVLPDYQGVGIGNRLSEFCAGLWCGLGGRAYSTTSHPAMVRYRSASPFWRRTRLGMVAPYTGGGQFKGHPGTKSSAGRITAGFQFVGPAADRATARAYTTARPTIWHDDLLDLLARYPGATTGFLCRLMRLSSSAVLSRLHRLAADGLVAPAGPGGGGDRRRSWSLV